MLDPSELRIFISQSDVLGRRTHINIKHLPSGISIARECMTRKKNDTQKEMIEVLTELVNKPLLENEDAK